MASNATAKSITVGVDIGGTFTDIVTVFPDGRLVSRKVLSTPRDFAIGITEGLTQLLENEKASFAQVALVNHGTTVATNCILEHKGAKTALLTTAGFRDVLEIGRVQVPVLYDLQYERLQPLVERRWRLELDERIGAQGEVLVPLDADQVRQTLAKITEAGITSVAVCLLNSYVNPEHEAAIGRILAEHNGPLSVTLSHELLREVGEYERCSTAVINSYVMPVVSQYLNSLQKRLTELGFDGNLLVMQSSGGLMQAQTAEAQPAHMIESGPAAGVIAARWLAQVSEHRNLISFDMGGTTAKASMIEDGQLTVNMQLEVGQGITFGRKLTGGGGYPVRSMVVDLAEVGAGGGSIVWFDRAGGLHVGPQSAGADPGPVCYGHGGTEPTVTDANVVLGYINDKAIAGGTVPIDAAGARRVIAEKVAQPMGKELKATAYGIYQIASANMMRAIKAVSIERGRDPREFALVAFGGNGPLFASEIAAALQIPEVIIPPVAGMFSVVGLLVADVRSHDVLSVMRRLDALTAAEIDGLMAAAEAAFRNRLMRQGREVHAMERMADLRYSGQRYNLTLPVPSGIIDDQGRRHLMQAFHDEHNRTYGHSAPEESVELVNLRLAAVEQPGVPAHEISRMVKAPRPSIDRESTSRLAYFGEGQGLLQTQVLPDRHSITADGLTGPAIIEEYDTTILVPPNWVARLDPQGNVILKRGSEQL